jgi:hypothetical protein
VLGWVIGDRLGFLVRLDLLGLLVLLLECRGFLHLLLGMVGAIVVVVEKSIALRLVVVLWSS